LQRAFPPNILMVPSLVFITTTGAEGLPHDVSSLGRTIHFWSHELIADRFGGQILSPLGDGSDTIVMSPAYSEPPLP
jgi:hypothetical protein